MTELLVAAMAHCPGMTGFPDRPNPEVASRALAGVDALRHRIEDFRPDLVVGISNDHFTATSMSCLAPFAIATGTSFKNPATPRFVEFLRVPQTMTPGLPVVSRALVKELLEAGVDVAQLDGRVGFDENFAVPLHLLRLGHVPFVPVIVNAVQPPMPSPRRCVDVGRELGAALRGQSTRERVAVIATGGLSHSVGTPDAGRIDTEFDRHVLDLLTAGRLDDLGRLEEQVISDAGNGAEEVRQWLVAAGVADGSAFDVLGYEPVREWLTAVAVVCTPTPMPN